MKKTKTRILVTGGAGFIGAHLTEKLIKNGHQVLVVDTLMKQGGIPFINKKSKFIKGDISSNKDLLRLFKNNKFEAVIHLAGLKCARESMIYPQKYALNNIIGSLNLLNKCVV